MHIPLIGFMLFHRLTAPAVTGGNVTRLTSIWS